MRPATTSTLVLEPAEDHDGHLDPANPLWQAAVRWLGVTDRADAEAADAADPLAPFRDRFVHAGDRIYLDGNSLGRLPLATRDRLAALAEEWGEQLVSGWPRWIDAPVTAGDAIAEVIGARPGEVLACDSTTVNLYKLAGAVIAARRPRALVADRHEFPTDRYVLEGLAAQHGLELRVRRRARPARGRAARPLPRQLPQRRAARPPRASSPGRRARPSSGT